MQVKKKGIPPLNNHEKTGPASTFDRPGRDPPQCLPRSPEVLSRPANFDPAKMGVLLPSEPGNG